MKKKRGATLAELVIVMAVLTVMMVMVLSFTTICNAWVKLGTYRYNLTQDERNISKALHNFVESLDEKDYHFYSPTSNTLAARTTGEVEYTFSYDPDTGTIHYSLPGTDEPASFAIEKVEDVSFYVRPSDRGLKLIYCTITFSAPPIDTHAKEVGGTYKILVATRAAGLN